MRILIAEEAFLCQLTEQVTDYYGAETTNVHGPWQAADCQQVLARWLDCGLIDCMATCSATRARSGEVVHFEYDADWRTRATEDGQYLVLARDDARALLSDPSTWRADGVGAGVMLCESRQAHGLPFDDWFDRLAGLPDHLIYDQPLDGASDGEAHETPAEPEPVVTARLWESAMEQAATGDVPVLCQVNRDAHLAFDWVRTDGETANSKSVEDVFFFVNPRKNGPGPPFPFGRHRFGAPAVVHSGTASGQFRGVAARPLYSLQFLGDLHETFATPSTPHGSWPSSRAHGCRTVGR